MEWEKRELNFLYFAKCPQTECSECPYKGRAIVYGPFMSRRRGISIGVNLYPTAKVCSFNCVYCFRGATELKTVEFTDLGVPTQAMLKKSLNEAISQIGDFKSIDFSGNGEPTLHPKLSEFVKTVKEFAADNYGEVSVGLFTNSSMLLNDRVPTAISSLDHVEAKIDAVNELKFNAINMPEESLTPHKILNGLNNLRKLFDGEIAVQVMLLRLDSLSNAEESDAEALAEALKNIEPDHVHLHTVYRRPRLNIVKPVSKEEIERFASILAREGFKVEIYV
jgi:wyosine [tRNA(Phe)-imidazoG37] synthetase (radical SAM superfamily)